MLSRVVCIFQFQPKYSVYSCVCVCVASGPSEMRLLKRNYRLTHTTVLFYFSTTLAHGNIENTIRAGYNRILRVCVRVNFLISVANRKECREFYLSNCVKAEEEQTNENNEQNI